MWITTKCGKSRCVQKCLTGGVHLLHTEILSWHCTNMMGSFNRLVRSVLFKIQWVIVNSCFLREATCSGLCSRYAYLLISAVLGSVSKHWCDLLAQVAVNSWPPKRARNSQSSLLSETTRGSLPFSNTSRSAQARSEHTSQPRSPKSHSLANGQSRCVEFCTAATRW